MPQGPGKPRKDDYGFVSPFRGRLIDKADAKIADYHKALKTTKNTDPEASQKLGKASARAEKAVLAHEEIAVGISKYRREQRNIRVQKAARMK